MSDVFISYSRRDIDFVRHLFEQLIARDREPGPTGRIFLNFWSTSGGTGVTKESSYKVEL